MLLHSVDDWSLASHHGGPGLNPGIYGRWSGTWTGFLLSILVLSCQLSLHQCFMFMFIYHQCYVVLGIDSVTK